MGHMRSVGALDRHRPHPLQAFAVASNDSFADHAKMGRNVLLAMATPPVARVSGKLCDAGLFELDIPLVGSGTAGEIIPFASFESILRAIFLFGLITIEGGRRLSVVLCAASVTNLPGFKIPVGSKSSLMRRQIG